WPIGRTAGTPTGSSDGGSCRSRATAGSEPCAPKERTSAAWSLARRGTLAFLRDGAILVKGRVVATGLQPALAAGHLAARLREQGTHLRDGPRSSRRGRDYPAFFHGQDDITGVPAGISDLVHHSNANMALYELRYEND